MKFSDLNDLFDNYNQALYCPSRQMIHFGCDCGCGGDLYTSESWDSEEKEADTAIQKMKEFCQEFHIEYDGIENDII